VKPERKIVASTFNQSAVRLFSKGSCNLDNFSQYLYLHSYT